MLVEWNDDGRHQQSPRATVPELFELPTPRTPGTAAVVCEADQLGYAALNARADRLAHRLRNRGVGAESVVAVLQERTPELVVVLLAVLKAGGTYLPIGAPGSRVTASSTRVRRRVNCSTVRSSKRSAA